eukprot:TRINITY_DN8867_c0_g1::TRINITY_DN8867_c0_g1_i1::g.19052::m.19052 TRINITY_DN8867_c0_g1::TRINITY_DN8867_c0_g1_i1::g.19052  ORF type:complete len:238 (+),score=65.09,sp/P43487/RANG_HUMAN/55.15/4e-42,Ran_BP1/PF00638.13/2.1e-40,Ran_BP1/PF00638.13/2.2e+03,WH1/PF00568.18/0.13 TRINITY_DN8867_c0_g1_i1:38-715(+)
MADESPKKETSNLFAAVPAFSSAAPIVSSSPATETSDVNERGESAEPAVDFKPAVNLADLPEVKSDGGEGDEDPVFVMRAKLFRFDKSADPPQWKERGLGNVKLLKHRQTKLVRMIMRREKTLKICANQTLGTWQELKPHAGSDRAWVWTAQDFADGVQSEEVLAIRFGGPEGANKFKELFDLCKVHNDKIGKGEESDVPLLPKEEADALDKKLAETKVEEKTES